MHRLCCSFVLAVVCGSIGLSQDSTPKIDFVEPAKTIEEALKRQAAAEGAAAAKLAEAEAAYAAEVDKANLQVVEDLKQLAKKAAAKGEISDAAKAWEAVLKIDSRDKDAAEFFRTIGRTEVVARAIAAAKEENIKVAKIVWAIDSNPSKGGFFKQKDGLWVEMYGDQVHARFKEIGRSNHTLQLERVPPGMYVTIHEDAFYWSGKHYKDGLWNAGGSGSWIK